MTQSLVGRATGGYSEGAMFRAIFFSMVLIAASVQALGAPRLESRTILDPTRHRAIPVLIYAPEKPLGRPLVILSHGRGLTNDSYAFLALSLVDQGYVVASIQHDLPGDAPTPNTGNIPRDRTPGWTAQVASILRVADVLGQSRDLGVAGKPILIGHSNGGDASMMAARDYPTRFSIVMSLDNRRFALPRAAQPRICTVRSSDQKPDPGVLPVADEVAAFSIRVTYARDLRHDDMWDGATQAQKTQILDAVRACLAP